MGIKMKRTLKLGSARVREKKREIHELNGQF